MLPIAARGERGPQDIQAATFASLFRQYSEPATFLATTRPIEQFVGMQPFSSGHRIPGHNLLRRDLIRPEDTLMCDIAAP